MGDRDQGQAEVTDPGQQAVERGLIDDGGMAIGGLGFGMYVAVELALVVDVLPD